MKPFVHQIRVRYSEVDQLGIAYYAHYLVWFEVARVEYLRHLGFSYAELEKQGAKLPVVTCQIKYLAPARYDDLLDIRTTLTEIGKTTVGFGYEVVNAKSQTVLAKGETVLACVNEHLKPIRLPALLRDCLPAQKIL